ncbi:MAG: hypothetical protein M9884_07170 [Rhodocyclaceae bacterium]|nr:hypothetical protein [Rhodocyclaceae bacterium]
MMLANAASVEAFAEVAESARTLLESRERPVVLLRKRAGCDEALPGVAPASPNSAQCCPARRSSSSSSTKPQGGRPAPAGSPCPSG